MPGRLRSRIGLELAETTVDGCSTKAPCGGDKSGPSPLDRRKGGLKRSAATEATGVPMGITWAGANRHLAPTLQQTRQQLAILSPESIVHLDSGYDGAPSRAVLSKLRFTGAIARKGTAVFIQLSKHWPGERLHSWMNNFGKLRRCTDRNGAIVDFSLYLTAALVTMRRLIQRTRIHYRWSTQPTTRRLK